MEQRDLIKDQIEQLGRVLGQILADFLNLKSKEKIVDGIETANQQLQNKLNFEVDNLCLLKGEELKSYIKSRNLTAEHLEILADYLKEAGIALKLTDPTRADHYIMSAIELLHCADEISNTVSFTCLAVRQELEKLL